MPRSQKLDYSLRMNDTVLNQSDAEDEPQEDGAS